MTGNDASGAHAGQGYGATLWEPDAKTIDDARISRYMRWLAQRGLGPAAGGSGGPAAAYQALWEWSVEQPGEFWTSIWDYFEVLGDRGGDRGGDRTRDGEGAALAGGTMPDVHWFPGATLNYAQNALRTAWTDPGRTAIVFSSERSVCGSLSYAELAAEVARVAAGLRSLGVGRGDRVAALLPNIPEAVIGLLATASIGAIWSSCSPDFGTRSVVDRFAQIEPAVLIAVDGYKYGGKEFHRADVVAEIAGQLPGLAAVVIVDLLGTADAAPLAVRDEVRVLRWPGFGRGEAGNGQTRAGEFEQVPFEHPLWVVYSSGTTGLPKPIVHGHGGVVLEHMKTVALHLDLRPGDRFTWYTTTGWMMWNFQVGGLLAGTTIVLYDGSATYPETGRLWQLAAEEKVSYLGVGAPYLMASRKAGLRPGEEYDLSGLRGIGSTGSPLPPEEFSWIYEAVRKDLLLGSMSGGTDVCTGFVGPCPLLPVRSGVISGRFLGAKVEAFSENGTSIVGKVGELVITRPMPSMPVMFWNDLDRTRYIDSYFAEFPGVWRHGDWIEILPDGGCVIYGRSDATLNRGGVRMGTSEFYRVVESFDEVADSLVVDTGGLGEPGKLVLYVALGRDTPRAQGGERTLSEELAGRIRATLRSQLSPRHVPDEIIRVPGIPRTLSGKKLEIPVRKILLGTPVAEAADPSALANPEVLGYFAAPHLATSPDQQVISGPRV
jgi:acetoacetyl-CoA synthetase